MGAPQILFRAAETAGSSVYDSVLAAFENNLKKEIAQGRLRCNLSTLFGAILSEEESSVERPRYLQKEMILQRQTFEKDWIEKMTAPNDFNFADSERVSAHLKETLEFDFSATLETALDGYRVSESDVKYLLTKVSDDIYETKETRSTALSLAQNAAKMREIAGALTVLLSNFSDWNWKEESVSIRAEFTRTKWRMYLDCELLDRLFLELIGALWGFEMAKIAQQIKNTVRKIRILRERFVVCVRFCFLYSFLYLFQNGL